MPGNYSKKIVLNGLMVALVFLATYFTRIPTPLPGGYFNLGDTVIIITALFLGSKSGLLAGALGSALADIAYGSFIFAPITLLVKGLEGYIVGITGFSGGEKESAAKLRVLSAITGAAVMVCGYFFAETFILGFFSEGFGLAAAFAELPINSLQGIISAIIAYLMSSLLIRLGVKDLLR